MTQDAPTLIGFELILPPRAAKAAIPELIIDAQGGLVILALPPRSR
jgi:hypothetical protein